MSGFDRLLESPALWTGLIVLFIVLFSLVLLLSRRVRLQARTGAPPQGSEGGRPLGGDRRGEEVGR